MSLSLILMLGLLGSLALLTQSRARHLPRPQPVANLVPARTRRDGQRVTIEVRGVAGAILSMQDVTINPATPIEAVEGPLSLHAGDIRKYVVSGELRDFVLTGIWEQIRQQHFDVRAPACDA